MEYIVQRAVVVIRAKYGEPLTLDELARTVMVSKFHFLRSFRRTTGVTPGRFLSAVRLAEAKHLLLGTSLRVSDISAQVGYSSIGSFTRRFTESVGLSPTQFRQASLTGESCTAPRLRAGRGPGTISGSVQPWHSVRDRAFVGVFDSPILQGQPIASTVVDTPGDFRFTGVPGGTWYVHTVALPCGGVPQDRSAAWQRPEPLVDCTGPLEVREQDPYAPERLEHLCLTPRPAEWFRPPVLLALPGGLPGGLPSGLPHTAVVCGLPTSGYREQSAAAV